MPASDDSLFSPPGVILRFDDRPALHTCGAVVRHHRRALGLTQHHLAARVGLSRDVVSNLERGRSWLSPYNLLHLAEVLGLEPWQLFPPRPTSPGAVLLRLVPFLPRDIQAALVELVRPRPPIPLEL